MKLDLLLKLSVPIFCGVAFASLGAAEETPTAPSGAKITITVVPPPPATPDGVPEAWTDIKGLTFIMRGQFFSSFERLASGMDAQIGQLTAKRSGKSSDQEVALRELSEAQARLKSASEELGKAGPDTWDEQKSKVGQAWSRVEEAYSRTKALSS